VGFHVSVLVSKEINEFHCSPWTVAGVQEIRATTLAFCALLADGSAVTWGEPQVGGDCSASVESDDWKMWVACKFQGHPANSMELGIFLFAGRCSNVFWSSLIFAMFFLWWVSSRLPNLTLQLLVVLRRLDEIEST